MEKETEKKRRKKRQQSQEENHAELKRGPADLPDEEHQNQGAHEPPHQKRHWPLQTLSLSGGGIGSRRDGYARYSRPERRNTA